MSEQIEVDASTKYNSNWDFFLLKTESRFDDFAKCITKVSGSHTESNIPTFGDENEKKSF